MPRKLVYDVAASLDGYIAGPDQDMSRFLYEGEHVTAYQARLAAYDTVLMGRGTYEAGYQFGMAPGDVPYPGKANYVFSKSLQLPLDSGVQVVRENGLALIDELKAGDGPDLYLCGGGAFAGWLAGQGRLDEVAVKINPILLAGGTLLMVNHAATLRLIETAAYDNGVVFARYAVAP